MLTLLRSTVRTNLHEIVNKEKEIHASFAVAPQTEKVTVIMCGKHLVKMEKALHFYNKTF